jgi:hypothetical protein
MTHPVRTLRRATVLAVGASLALAGPAGAHPYFHGGEAPVDSLATLTLDLAHGCETEAEGWVLEVEDADEDADEPEVVTWIADGGEEPAPTFDLDVVASGEPGDERYVRVFQACDDTTYRWVGTPDEPAEDPAVGLTLVDADPDSPPPPEEPDEPEEDAAEDAEDADEADEAEGTDDGTDEADADGPEDEDGTTEDEDADAADDAEPTDDATEDDTTEDEEELATDEVGAEGDGGVPAWLIVALVVVLLAGAVGAVVLRRRGPAEGA